MVVKMSSPGRSFGGVADYCLHDPRMPGEAPHPESAERVEWTETRNPRAVREASPQALHHFTQADQVNQLVPASEADPDRGFMARMMALCSL